MYWVLRQVCYQRAELAIPTRYETNQFDRPNRNELD